MRTITIMPDYGGACCWWSDGSDSENRCWVGAFGGLPRIRIGTKLRTNPLEEDFSAWQSDFEAMDCSPSAWAKFDLRAFHREGMRLARKLKRQQGERFRVVYEKPCEDPGHRNNERREVLSDGSTKLLRSRAEIRQLTQ